MNIFKKLLKITGSVINIITFPTTRAITVLKVANILAGFAVKATKSTTDDKLLQSARNLFKDIEVNIKQRKIEEKAAKKVK